MRVSLLMQWALFLPCTAALVLWLGLGLREVWLLQALYRQAQTALLLRMWRRGRWMSIKL